jgi:prolyl-tRNA synthetase
MLADIQQSLFDEADARLKANITPADDWSQVEAHFAEGNKAPGWLDVRWSRPTGDALEKVVERLKALKLTLRNAPMGQSHPEGQCIFTGEPCVERVLVGRAY